MFRQFLSTLSLRRATEGPAKLPKQIGISIHALLAESDLALRQLQFALRHFYPRSPCGERQALGLSGWLRVLISIHALLAESDACITTTTICIVSFLSTLSLRRATNTPIKAYNIIKDFYPRSPCGERPQTGLTCGGGRNISIHALLAESDSKSAQNSGALLRI